MADLAEGAGVTLANLATETREAISTLLSGGNVTNPVDVMLAGDRPGTYEAVVERLARDPAVGTLAVGLNVPHAFDEPGAAFYANQVSAAARAGDGDVVAFSFVPGEPGPELQAAAADAGIPLLLGAREGLAAIASAIAFASRITIAGGEIGAAPSPQVAPPDWASDPRTADELEIRT
jgi:acyl-CoA synthetase (NDP forming)